MALKDNKKIILKEIKLNEKSTSEIASIINRDYYFTLKLLAELQHEGKIIKKEIGSKYTYWALKEAENENSFT
jgi:transposase